MNKTSTQYVSDSFLAERYSVSRNTVWRWVQQGTIPEPIKFSHGCTRWNLAEVEAREQAIRAGTSKAIGALSKARASLGKLPDEAVVW